MSIFPHKLKNGEIVTYADASKSRLATGSNLELIKLLALFVFWVITLQWAWDSAKGTGVETFAIEKLTVPSAVCMINAITPNIDAQAIESRIVSRLGVINVLGGCDGTDLYFIVLAGVLSMPMAIGTRVLGAIIGVPLIFIANQARLLALFYSNAYDRQLFGELHGIVTPLVLMVVAIAFLAIMLRLDDVIRGVSTRTNN